MSIIYTSTSNKSKYKVKETTIDGEKAFKVLEEIIEEPDKSVMKDNKNISKELDDMDLFGD